VTGTPLQNNLHELWALLNFLLPDVFASSDQFDEWFNLDVDDDDAKKTMIAQLHKILRPFMLRRLKVDVEKSLPPKTETILFANLAPTQKGVYRGLLKRDANVLQGGGDDGPKVSRSAISNIAMQLRKCCNHPHGGRAEPRLGARRRLPRRASRGSLRSIDDRPKYDAPSPRASRRPPLPGTSSRAWRTARWTPWASTSWTPAASCGSWTSCSRGSRRRATGSWCSRR